MVWSWDAVDWNMLHAFGMMLLLPIVVLTYLIVTRDNCWKTWLGFLFGLLLFVSLPLLSAYGPWELKAEGVYDHSELYETNHRTSHGGRYTHHHLVLFFDDGRTFRLDHVLNIPHPKGTRLRILTKNGKYKFEKY